MCVNRVKASLLRSWYVRVHEYIHELPRRAHLQGETMPTGKEKGTLTMPRLNYGFCAGAGNV